MSNSKTEYMPALDGLRALSILLVIVAHAGLERYVPGGLGVVIFFVISGYLITGQIIDEVEANGILSIKTFYLRRFFRLAPALAAYIALFSILPLITGQPFTSLQFLSGVFYFANYYKIFIGYPPLNPFPILWSLAIEEHFYLFFPFILQFFRFHLKKLIPWLTGSVVLALLWRIVLYDLCAQSGNGGMCGVSLDYRLGEATDTMFDSVIYGAFGVAPVSWTETGQT